MFYRMRLFYRMNFFNRVDFFNGMKFFERGYKYKDFVKIIHIFFLKNKYFSA